MRVFFLSAYKGKEKFSKEYSVIFNFFIKKGHHLLDDDVVNISYRAWKRKIGTDKTSYEKYVEEKMSKLCHADWCVFEASEHSIGIGYMIEKALNEGKSTLVLYKEGFTPIFISGIKNSSLILRPYTAKTLESILKSSYKELRKTKESRFNFYAHPKLMAFVEKKSKGMGMSQSAFIRSLLLEEFRKEQNIQESPSQN